MTIFLGLFLRCPNVRGLPDVFKTLIFIKKLKQHSNLSYIFKTYQMKILNKLALLLAFSIASTSIQAADSLRVLFIGNSYTYVNNLPQLVASFAAATGDFVYFASNTPGGYTLQQHSSNTTSTSLIAQGKWNFVVLQEQSQLPAFPDAQVQNDVFPYARMLDSMIKASDSCTKTLFYMTWGRKNGDQANCSFFPPLCTYQGMDSMLQLRYTMMADSNKGVISPVAKVWRKIRDTYPAMNLYDNDESHPSLLGSYAAAVTFYTVMFKKSPIGNTYDGGLSASDAATIRQVVKQMVYDSLAVCYRFYPKLKAGFNFNSSNDTVSFQNTSANGFTYQWTFGDGSSSTQKSPIHKYATSGNYTVKLIAKRCNTTDTVIKAVNVVKLGIENLETSHQVKVVPNPAKESIQLHAAYPIQSVRIVSLMGQTMRTFNSNGSTNMHCSLIGLQTGVYVVMVRTKEGEFHSRLVVE